MRQRQSSVTIETQLPVISSGATCFAGRGAWAGGGPNCASVLTGASKRAAAPHSGTTVRARNLRVIAVSPVSFCRANAGAPSGPVGNLLEVGAGNERLSQIHGILHHRGDCEPSVAIRLLVKIIIFLEHRIFAIKRTVFAQVPGAQLRGHYFQRPSMATFSSCSESESREARPT